MLRMVTCAVIELQACPVLYSYGVSYRSRQIATCSLHLRIGLIPFFFFKLFFFIIFMNNKPTKKNYKRTAYRICIEKYTYRYDST